MKPLKNAPTLIDKRQFGLWKAFFFAFFSPRVYVDVAKRWTGLCLSYFLFMIVIVTLPFGVRFEWAVHQYYKDHVFDLVHNLPPISIENGQVEFNHFMPYRINNQAGDTIGMIDTTGLNTDIDHRIDPELTWLLTNNALHFNPPDLKIMPNLKIELEKSKHTEIFDEDVDGVIDINNSFGTIWPKLLIYGFAFLIYPCVVFVFFGVLGTIFAAFAWAAQYYVWAVFRYRINYRAVYRLLIVALTAPLSICFGLAALGVVLSNAPLYYLILFAIYFNLAVLAVRRTDRAIVFA